MKKKLLAIVLTLVATLCLCFSISACTFVSVTHKLNFIVDDEIYATIDTSGEEAITMPQNPTKDDYIFDGWYWDKDIWQRPFTADSLLHEKLTSNMSVYAKWLEEDVTKQSYTVTFNSMGGSDVKEVSVVYGNLLGEPAKPTKAGYIFAGWCKEADCSTKWDFAADTVTENITLYAKWVEESNATGCDILSADGLTVAGTTLSVKVSASQNTYALSSAITVSPYATWTVSTDLAGKDVIPSATVELEVGENTFYINVVSGNGSNKKQYTVNIYRRESYTVTFEPENGENNMTETVEEGISNPSSYTIEDEFDFAPLVNKTVGYIFDGWYTKKNNGEGEKVEKIKKGSKGQLSLYAHWKLEEYTITYHNVEGVTNTNATSFTVESEQIVITDVAKIGYKFDGWFTNELLTEKANVTLETGSHGNRDFWAKWTAIEYSINYVYDGTYEDGATNPTTYTIESQFAFKEPNKEGYVFGGWYTEATQGVRVYGIDKGRTGTLTVYARWIHITTITFNTRGGSYVEPIIGQAGSRISAPSTVPTKDYYTFAGWFTDESCENQYKFDKMPEEDFILYAKWTPIHYTIHYHLNDGVNSVENPADYTVEEEITLKAPTKIGHTFIAWFTNAEFTSAPYEKIVRGTFGELHLYASFSVNEYTIHFNTNGGTSQEDIKQNYGTVVNRPSDPTKVGYTFVDWYTEQELQHRYTFTTMPADDITLWAQWSLVNYQIKYNLDGGKNNPKNPATYNIESGSITFETPTKTGYTFEGWFTGDDYQTELPAIAAKSHGAVEVYAKWKVIVYDIEYVLEDGATNPNTKNNFHCHTQYPKCNPQD